MSPQYLSPGVYVEEKPGGARPIQGVGTSTAAFVGFTEKLPDPEKFPNPYAPVFVSSWGEYVKHFGEFIPGSYLAYSVYGYFNNGGSSCYVAALPTSGDGAGTEGALPAQASLPSAAKEGIETLTITALAEGAASVEVSKPAGEDLPEDAFNLKIKVGTNEESFENLSFKRGKGVRNVVEVVNKESKLVKVAEKQPSLDFAEKMPKPGTYPLAVPTTTALVERKVSADEVVGSAPKRVGVNALEVCDDVTMVVCPDAMALYQAGEISREGVQIIQTAMIDHCNNMGDRVAILDALPNLTPQEVKEWAVNDAAYDSSYAALYYPWIKVANPLPDSESILVPPSGHVAGLFARVDNTRGVHKAPANEIVQGAIGLEFAVSKPEQDILNPNSINCIRAFPGRGIRVWGARTLSSDAEWRYINVRRLFNFVEKSIENGTQWAVFEPNDHTLWMRIRRDVKAFLSMVWSSGALFGLTAAEAFYVKCDAELNPVEVRDAGMVITEIGICPVKPAEFVIFRISQWAGPGAE